MPLPAEVDADRVCHAPQPSGGACSGCQGCRTVNRRPPIPPGSGIGSTRLCHIRRGFSRSQDVNSSCPAHRRGRSATGRPAPPLRMASAPAGRDRRVEGRHLRGVRRRWCRRVDLAARLRRALQPHRPARSTWRAPRSSTARPPARANPTGVTALSGSVPGQGLLPRRRGHRHRRAPPCPTPAVSGSITLSGDGRDHLPGQPDHRPDRSADRLAHRQPGGARPRRLRHQQHLRDGSPAAGHLDLDRAGAQRDRHGHRQQRERPHCQSRHAGNGAGRRPDRPADGPTHGSAGGEDHRRDPGHRRHQSARRPERHHRAASSRRRTRPVASTVLPPDRRDRRRRRPGDTPGVGRASSCSARRPPRPCRSATTSR